MIQLEGSGGNGKQWSIISSDDVTGAAAASGPGNFVIYDDSSGGLGDVLTLTGVGGSMGLGTQEPGAKLHVSGGNIKVDSGYGIDFSATGQVTGMTNELLDDYEEGTWTPTVVGLTGLDSASGTYVKIGNLVTVALFVNIGTKTYIGSGSGGTTIQFPLPFNSSGVSNAYFGASVGNLRYIDFSGSSAEQFCANIGGTNNILYGRWLKNNSNFTDVTLGDLYNSFSIHMSVTYRTA